MAKLVVRSLGTKGVNVDRNPLELDDSELVHAQNVVSDSSAGLSSIVKRPGLIAFTTSSTAGSVLGGSDLPLANQSASGTHYIYIGRGATS